MSEIIETNITMEGIAKETEGNTIEKILQWLENGTLITGIDFQRNFVWADWKKSNLILSTIIGLPIPAIHVYRPVKGQKIKKVFDGKQRLTTFQQFANNKFALKVSKFPFPKFIIDGKLYNKQDFQGKAFYELPEELQTIFLETNIKMEIASGACDELAEVFFSLMNIGAESLKPQEVRLATMGKEVRQFFNKQKEKSIFQHMAISDKQRANNIQHDILAQIATILEVGITDLSGNNVDGFINQFRDTGLPEQLKGRISDVTDYLSSVSDILVERKKTATQTQTRGRKANSIRPVKINYLSKLAVVALAPTVEKAIEGDISTEVFAGFVSDFFENPTSEYTSAARSKTADVGNVRDRINALTKAFYTHTAQEFEPTTNVQESEEPTISEISE